jgi:hypothetical protein
MCRSPVGAGSISTALSARPLRARVLPLSKNLLIIGALLAVSLDAHAQSANPYYQLQCEMSGAYCDRVYREAPRRETFDEMLARKDRERARIEQERAARIEAARLKREREQAQRAEAQRQARDAERARRQQLVANNIATAPAWIRYLHNARPMPQYWLAGLLLIFAGLAFVGRREFSSATIAPFAIHLTLALFSISVSPAAAESAGPLVIMAFVALLPLTFLALNTLHAIRGWHHLFVSHPVADIVAPPLRDGELIPKTRFAEALRPDPTQLFDYPHAFQSRNLAAKAEALRAKLEADGSIAEAAMRRDRARAQKIAADEALRAVLKQLPWWRRILWRFQ